MKKNVSLQVKGSVRIRITGSFCERFLNLCAYHGIALRNLTPAPDGYEAVVSLPDFWKIKPWVKPYSGQSDRTHRSSISDAAIS